MIVLTYGLWHGEANFVWAGIVALILAAVLRRMIGRFRLRADRSGVEIEGTLLPPGDAMPESSDDVDESYLPSQRRWVTVKNRAYWRYELEREGAIRSRQRALLA